MSGISLKQVAQTVGCSLAAVSSVLDEKGSTAVEPALAQRIREIAARMGYQSHFVAQSEKGGDVGIGLPLIEERGQAVLGDFWMKMMSGMEMVARKNAMSFMIIGEDKGNVQTNRALRYLQEGRVNALVVPEFYRHMFSIDLESIYLPIVWMHKQRSDGHPAIGYNGKPGLEDALLHLKELGHHNILWLSSGEHDDRSSNKADIMDAHNLSAPVLEIDPDQRDKHGLIQDACEALRQLLSKPKRPSAIIAGNDKLALACYFTCMQLGMHIPRDISIISFNDVRADLLVPPLTVISANVPRVGQRAAEIALKLAESADEMHKWRFYHEDIASSFIRRESTAPPFDQ